MNALGRSTSVDCAVCVVTYNSAETIGGLLRSVAAERMPLRVRIHDNDSSDDTVGIIHALRDELGIDIDLHASDINVGFPIACNALMSTGGEATVAIINPDVELTRGTLQRLAAVVAADDSVGIATCRLVTRQGDPQTGAARRRPRLNHLVTNRVARRMDELTRFGRVDPLLVDRDVECTAGALMVCRRGVLDEVGYLDESVFMYLEDVDFAARIRHAGYRIRYLGTSWVWHDGGASTPTPHEVRIYQLLPRVWITYMTRYGSRYERVAARPFLFAVAAGHALLRASRGRSSAGQRAAMREALTYRPQKKPTWGTMMRAEIEADAERHAGSD